MFQMFLRVFFESVCEVWFFEKEASVFASLSQVTKSFVYPIVLKGFLSCFNPFNNFVPPLNLVDNLAFRKFIRDGRGSSYGP